ncbi:unnamed protein product [Litomosoides sigmodontis]|uniref:Uncharacterized protein n=1 Tax=Litomosoides sigmodontis TaxID=42156 RepID=A0A3P7JKB2_LITSI|nr:unnamed protein product [Litomosoides sigmodontis]
MQLNEDASKMSSLNSTEYADVYYSLSTSAYSDGQSSHSTHDDSCSKIDTEVARHKLRSNFNSFTYCLRRICCCKTRPYDPSMGALPREWLDPNRMNFRLNKTADHQCKSESEEKEQSMTGFSTINSNTE